MDRLSSDRETTLSPRARAAWRRAADELLIDAIFGDRVYGDIAPIGAKARRSLDTAPVGSQVANVA